MASDFEPVAKEVLWVLAICAFLGLLGTFFGNIVAAIAHGIGSIFSAIFR